ncbi:MAG: helix-turn-helix transcriptional regulator [Christensenella sp.]|uniref:helix-turn-helix domain-containing protein n=1 Tax=Christensenella sp. TaxID=1935934 RepID=UPI002B1F1332|nr:helix-turn-helix transcriptional regulator [Christensenella sp.]MEA5003019.1 helix-turn-helix transcriptional regulator [Christensenella sp.]
MKDYKSVLEMKDYGKIVLKVNQVMDQKNIARNKLAKLTDVRFEVIDRLYKGKLERVDLDILARVCFVLECSISDVLEFKE